MSRRTRVIQYGLGPIGLEAARLILSRPQLELVGAVDVDPNLVGKDLGTLLNLKRRVGIPVVDDPEKALRRKAAVVVHSTRSHIPDVADQLEWAAANGLHLVSSTEELLYPWLQHPRAARRLDRVARRKKVSILGTGVNPGFVMDTLALVMTGVCRSAKAVRVQRVVNAGTRRGPLQRKVGAGLSPAAFRKLVRERKLGHVGLLESLALIGHGLGWELDITDRIEPVIATQRQRTRYVEVKPGQVAGIKHQGWGRKDGKTLVHLDLRMYVGAEDPHDAVEIIGDPPLRVVVTTGVSGDVATVAALVNAVPLLADAPRGLITMLDLPIPRCGMAGR